MAGPGGTALQVRIVDAAPPRPAGSTVDPARAAGDPIGTAGALPATRAPSGPGTPGSAAGRPDGTATPWPAGEAGYLPRSALTVAPTPVTDVVVEHPLAEGQRRHYAGVLSLFIDETGRVVRIRAEGEPLPEALDHAAREAFGRARFHPGEVDGRKVRSRIRIEVTFDERPGGQPAAPEQ